MKDEIGRYIGLVTQTNTDTSIQFLASGEERIKHDVLVGVYSDEGDVVIGVINSIKTLYYLNNPDNYFLSRAVKNDLLSVKENNAPKVAFDLTAKIVGIFRKSENGEYVIASDSIPRYTCKPLDKVFVVNPVIFCSAYGLKSNGVLIGRMCYPYLIPAYVAPKAFKSHSLISGITGTGKSRLAALLVEKIALLGGHVTVIDPHDEYAELLEPFSTDLNISRIPISITNVTKSFFSESIFDDEVCFSSQLLTAPTLAKLLPNLSGQQEEQLTRLFNKTYGESDRKDIQFIIQEINKITTEFSKAKDGGNSSLYGMYQGLKNRLEELKRKNIISEKLPSWLETKPSSVEIFVGDYNKENAGKRLISAILEQFLRLKSGDEFRVLVIDEAHQLLNLGSEETINTVCQLLREARKFNLSIIMVTQNYDDIPIDIRHQMQNVFRFREFGCNETDGLARKMCYVSLAKGAASFVLSVDTISAVRENNRRKRKSPRT